MLLQSFGRFGANAVEKQLFGYDDEDNVYDVAEGREGLHRSRSFGDFILGNPPSPGPGNRNLSSPGPGNRKMSSPGLGTRKLAGLLSRPSPDLSMRKKIISDEKSETEDASDKESETRFEKGRNRRPSFFNNLERKLNLREIDARQNSYDNQSGSRSRQDSKRRIENEPRQDESNEGRNKSDSRRSETEPRKQNTENLPRQKMFLSNRGQNDSRRLNETEPRRDSRQRHENGSLVRAKSLTQLLAPLISTATASPKRGRSRGRIEKTSSFEFEEHFRSESSEVLSHNPAAAVQRKETRL